MECYAYRHAPQVNTSSTASALHATTDVKLATELKTPSATPVLTMLSQAMVTIISTIPASLHVLTAIITISLPRIASRASPSALLAIPTITAPPASVGLTS